MSLYFNNRSGCFKIKQLKKKDSNGEDLISEDLIGVPSNVIDFNNVFDYDNNYYIVNGFNDTVYFGKNIKSNLSSRPALITDGDTFSNSLYLTSELITSPFTDDYIKSYIYCSGSSTTDNIDSPMNTNSQERTFSFVNNGNNKITSKTNINTATFTNEYSQSTPYTISTDNLYNVIFNSYDTLNILSKNIASVNPVSWIPGGPSTINVLPKTSQYSFINNKINFSNNTGDTTPISCLSLNINNSSTLLNINFNNIMTGTININTTTVGANANIVLNGNNNDMSGLTITFTSANPEVTVNGTKINTLTNTSVVSGINVRYSS